MSFNGKEITLINFLITFYKNKIDLLNDIIDQKTPLSLRLLDWLVTNYSKKYNITYPLKCKSDTIYFNIYIDYKNQLKAYSKKFFDPFCRQKRLIIDPYTLKWRTYTIEENVSKKDIVTTVGQLNFFRWIIEHNIINYIKNNYEDIEKDMQNTIKLDLEKNIKRRQLSKSATKTINIDESKIIIKFE